jgi:hypothetical protein
MSTVQTESIDLAQRKTSTKLNGWLFRYHRWIGLVCCFAVMIWGASGVMHPIMSRLNPVAINMLPPPQEITLHTALTPAEVMKKAGISAVNGLRLVSFAEGLYYQLGLPNSPERIYLNVYDGQTLVNGDARYAEYLARHFLGEKSAPVKKVELLTDFDDDYLSVNRLLPVYRISFDREDGMRAYVETSPARLAALVDNRKAILGSVFRFMHNWDFLQGHETLRLSLITAFLLVTFISSLSGIWMYGFMWKRNTLRQTHTGLRRYHRGIGITVALFSLLFVISAEFHLLKTELRGKPTLSQINFLANDLDGLPESLRHSTLGGLSFAKLDGAVHYVVLPKMSERMNNSANKGDEHDHHNSTPEKQEKTKVGVRYIHSATGVETDNANQKMALSLAAEFSGKPDSQIKQVQLFTKFEGEYGFINKRLPVWKISYDTPQHTAYYVENSSGALAAVVSDADRLEGYSFSYLHKFHWLDFAGKDFRDFVMGVFGLGNFIVALLGFWLFTRRYRK